MKILRHVLESVITHTKESDPFECCGILLARNEDHVVCRSLRAENRENNNPERRYMLGHKAHIEAVEMEVTADVQIVGYYHSHPYGGTKPSHWDAEQAVERVVYLITAPKDGSFENAAWEWKNNQFVPVPLEVSN